MKLLLLNTKRRLTGAVFLRGAPATGFPWSCQLCPAAEEDEKDDDEGSTPPFVQRWAHLLRSGSDWRSAMCPMDPEASHVSLHGARRSKRGERFSLGCIISVPARFRKAYFSSVPWRITERAARMFLPFFYILSQWKRKKRGMFLMKDSRAHPGMEMSFAWREGSHSFSAVNVNEN